MFGRCSSRAIRAAADGALRKANRIIERDIMSGVDKIQIDLASRGQAAFFSRKLAETRKCKTPHNSRVLMG